MLEHSKCEQVFTLRESRAVRMVVVEGAKAWNIASPAGCIARTMLGRAIGASVLLLLAICSCEYNEKVEVWVKV